LRVKKLPTGQQPKLAMKSSLAPEQNDTLATTTAPSTAPTTTTTAPVAGVVAGVDDRWEIEEVARRDWVGPRNDFSRIAFDADGVWVLPEQGPMIRSPLPKE
jgi:hypothetical protein